MMPRGSHTIFCVPLVALGFGLLGVWISSNLPMAEPRHKGDITRDIRVSIWDKWVIL